MDETKKLELKAAFAQAEALERKRKHNAIIAEIIERAKQPREIKVLN